LTRVAVVKPRARPPAGTSRTGPPAGTSRTGPPAAKSNKKRNWRRTLFRVHGWLGLNAGLLLYVICLSGTVAVFSNELDWLVTPEIRVANDGSTDWTAILDSLDAAYPTAANLGIYLPGASGFTSKGDHVAALAYLSAPSGETRKVHVHPGTGQILADYGFFNTQRFFRSFHRRFFDGTRGIIIVTLMGFVLLAAALTGFFFYRGWLKQLVTLRLFREKRLRWSDLHKVSGIWGLLFTLLIALTGIFYFVELLYQGADRYNALLPPPMKQVAADSLSQFGPQPELLPASVYVRNAERALPGLRIQSMRISTHPERAVYVDGQTGNPLTRDRADKVHLHPFTGHIIDTQHTRDLGVVPFITDAVDPLHFGYFGGLWTKIPWFLFGLLLSFSILSGLRLWVVRQATGRKKRCVMLRGSVVSIAITLGYLVHVTFTVVGGIRSDYNPSHAAPKPVASTTAGPWSVRLDCAAPCPSPEPVHLALAFEGTGMPNYTQVDVWTRHTERMALGGSARYPSGVLPGKSAHAQGDSVFVHIVDRAGTAHLAAFVPGDALPVTPPRETRWPDTAPGVWWVIGTFAALIAGSLLYWLWDVRRVLAMQRDRQGQ